MREETKRKEDAVVETTRRPLHLNAQTVDEMTKRVTPLPLSIDAFESIKRAMLIWSNPTIFEVSVEQFIKKIGHVVKGFPDHRPNLPMVLLRKRLIAEEARETIDALDEIIGRLEVSEQPLDDVLLAELLDGLCDSIYVLVGTALSLGLPLRAAFEEVHRSNMTKSGQSKIDVGEKSGIKGPDFTPPDLVSIIREASGRAR